ncbi:MAG: nitrilase-related carbon-nitrogen hydrolase [Candidatus Muiribacteriota bacterium]
MKAGFIQNNPIFGELKQNVDNIISILEKYSDAVIVLPELFATGYNFIDKTEVRHLSEEIDRGYTFEGLSYISKKNNLTVVFGFPEKDKDKFFNSQAVIEKGKTKAVYRKTHLFNRENLFFSPGDSGFLVVEIENGIKLGLMICFDWIFPESARTLSLKGADIICHSSNLVLPYCPAAAVTRAIENHVFYILSNRIGTENRNNINFNFIGLSEIIAPNGDILIKASENQPQISICELNHVEARNKSLNPFNNLFEDRRSEFYL